MRSRLYLRIYVAFLGIAVLCMVTAGFASALLRPDTAMKPGMQAAARLVLDGLDEDDLPASLAARAASLDVKLALFDAEGRTLATTDPALTGPNDGGEGWVHGKHLVGVRLQLPDGRWLVAATPPRHGAQLRPFAVLAAVLAMLALACWPLARSITSRLEALQRGVAAFGGDPSARVEVCGSDEVARLATSFNTSAERIEQLVLGQQRMLGHASHELRSPLARLRMALGLLEQDDDTWREAVRNVDELDELVGDLLTAARLQAGAELRRSELDLGALLAEEAARAGLEISPPAAPLEGDAALLRLAIRNLLENARRHAPGALDASLEAGPLRIVVADRGPGVPEAERERIFEPFYQAPGHRESDGGVGLGLALVAEIARAHGGSVACTAREGGGAVFTLTLPG